MALKQIKEFLDDSAPADDSMIVLQTAASETKKSTVVNFLKRVFTHQDVFSDYLIPGLTLDSSSPATSPDLEIFRDGIHQLAFSGTGGTEQGFFTLHLLHDLKADTEITFHIHWAHNVASPSGSVKWNIEYSIARGYAVGTFGASTTLSTTQEAPAQYVHQITDDDDMVIAGTNPELVPDAVIMGRVYRDPGDGADTFSDDAFLLFLDVHYTKSRVGTTERNAPFTSGGF